MADSLARIETVAQEIAGRTGSPVHVVQDAIRIMLAAWADYHTGTTEAGDAFLARCGLHTMKENVR